MDILYDDIELELAAPSGNLEGGDDHRAPDDDALWEAVVGAAGGIG